MSLYGAYTDDLKQYIEELDCSAVSSKKMTFSSWTGNRVQWDMSRINWNPSDYQYVHSGIKSDLIQRLGSADRLNKICSWNVYKFLNNPNPNSRIAQELKPFISKPANQVTLNDIILAEQAWASAKRTELIKTYARQLGTVALDAYEKEYLEAIKAGKDAASAINDAENAANNAASAKEEQVYGSTTEESSSFPTVPVILALGGFGIGIFLASRLERT